jgi:hypothetical protein
MEVKQTVLKTVENKMLKWNGHKRHIEHGR